MIFDTECCGWGIKQTSINKRLKGKSKITIIIEDTKGNVFGGYFNSKIEYALLKKLMQSIGMVKMQKLDSVQTGYLTERISSDVGVVGKTYLDVVDVVFEILTNAVFLIYIAFLNWQIFLLMMVYVVEQ